MTDAPRQRRTRARIGIAGTLALMMVAMLVSPASARWIRGFSDINTAGDDIAVCDRTITLEAELAHQKDSFEGPYPDFEAIIDVSPYPGFSDTVDLPLYGTASDAINQTNEVAVVTVPYIYRGFDAARNSYIFTGQATIATPAGYGNGDILYTWAFETDPDGGIEQVAVPFEIGDPDAYDCPPSALPWAVFSKNNTVTPGAVLPHTFIFDAREVNPKSLVLTGSNGSAPVEFVGAIRGFGFGQLDLDDIDIDCETEKLVLSGVDDEGRAYEEVIGVRAGGRNCDIVF